MRLLAIVLTCLIPLAAQDTKKEKRQAATERIYRSSQYPSHISVTVATAKKP